MTASNGRIADENLKNVLSYRLPRIIMVFKISKIAQIENSFVFYILEFYIQNKANLVNKKMI
jgi:hypothetical protein